MPIILNRLDPLFVANVKKPGMYPDGGGLYLQVTNAGAKSWIFRYQLAGRNREMGLGGLVAVPLKSARKLAADARELKARGEDPIAKRDAERASKQADVLRSAIFKAEAESYIKAHEPSWKNGGKSGDQWRSSMESYAYPVIGNLPVSEIDTPHILKILEPIWATKTETASRVRNRIELILSRATTRKMRSGDNPARWRGHLDQILPKRSKVRKVKHHPALPYAQMGTFMAALRQQDGIAAKALEWTILNAVRSADTIQTTWKEIDLAAKVWTLPVERTKTRELRVPLTARAIAILNSLPGGADDDDFVFPGVKEGEPLSPNAMLALLERMGRNDITTHGFRSSFKDFSTDCCPFDNIVSEMALGHAIGGGDQTEAAYRRSDLFEKRKRLMTMWSDFCDAKPAAKGSVVPMRRRRGSAE